VAVEKLGFRKIRPTLGDRKCLGKLQKSFIGHPDAILFSRISREGVFQQPLLIALNQEIVRATDEHCFSCFVCATVEVGCVTWDDTEMGLRA
jgi:hypothetical protein